MANTTLVWMVSLKFAPGLFKELFFIGDHLHSRGVRVRYLLSEGYRDIAPAGFEADYIASSASLWQVVADSLLPWRLTWKFIRLFRQDKPLCVYFYNTHPVEVLLSWFIRSFSVSTSVVFHIHEPYQPDKHFLSFKQRLVVYIQEFLNRRIAAQCHHIVVPSPHAEELFRNFYPGSAQVVHFAPLMIPDEPGISYGREYALMAGRIYPDGRWSDFVGFVNYFATHGAPFRIRLLTSSSIGDDMLSKLTDEGRKVLDVISKRPLSDDEISQNMANAFVLLSMHPRGSQSGVTPVAFMNSTPIVARDIPMFSQYIKPMKNGILVSPGASPSEWMGAVLKVHENLSSLSAQARKSYEDIFHEKNWEVHFGWLNSLIVNEGQQK